jgi:hypothetical protein
VSVETRRDDPPKTSEVQESRPRRPGNAFRGEVAPADVEGESGAVHRRVLALDTRPDSHELRMLGEALETVAQTRIDP